jgi:hypothetical protein
MINIEAKAEAKAEVQSSRFKVQLNDLTVKQLND